MKNAIRKGFSFGLTSGVITTLGIMIGLNASTGSKIVVIGGIISIAIADAFSDALGIHVSVESEAKYSEKQIWSATLSTFFAKFIFALTFIVPILLFSNSIAILISALWGILLLSIYSFYLAKRQKIKPHKVIAEHLLIAIAVIIITHFAGQWIARTFI
ncbi:MAG TPA: hypothetical protein ENN28_02455 [Candidatus Uhrbacteria bacterium]|nr:hypothetical protein [Candidatus Uhrbacteria bacterium]